MHNKAATKITFSSSLIHDVVRIDKALLTGQRLEDILLLRGSKLVCRVSIEELVLIAQHGMSGFVARPQANLEESLKLACVVLTMTIFGPVVGTPAKVSPAPAYVAVICAPVMPLAGMAPALVSRNAAAMELISEAALDIFSAVAEPAPKFRSATAQGSK